MLVGASIRGKCGMGEGGVILQTIVVCRCCREASQTTISQMRKQFIVVSVGDIGTGLPVRYFCDEIRL
jgi:hypothetical protein